MVAILTKARNQREAHDSAAELAGLAAALVAGDERALPTLIRALESRVLQLARDMTGDDHLAEDIAQETFMIVQQRIADYDPTYSLCTWVLTIAGRKAIDSMRSGQRRKRHLLAFWRAAPRRAGAASSAAASANELNRIVDELLTELPPRQRHAFVLRDLQSLSTSETAATLGCSEGAVKAHIASARRKVRDLLAARYPEYLEDPRP